MEYITFCVFHENLSASQHVLVALFCYSPNCSSCTVLLAPAFNRDNVEWTEEQEACAKKKVLENSQPLPSEKQGVVVVLSDTLSQHEQHQGSIP